MGKYRELERVGALERVEKLVVLASGKPFNFS